MLYSMRFAVPSLLLACLLAPGLAFAQDAGAADPDAGVAEPEVTEEETEASPESTDEGPTPEELEEARQLFSDGVRYASEGEFGRAVIAFRRAAEIKAAPAVVYNLASALYESGELADAAAQAQAVVADEDSPPELKERAEVLLDEIRDRTATLTIRLGGEADGAKVDGELLDPAQLERPLILEPGVHTVVGLRRGEEMTHRELEIRAGGQAHIDVSVIPTPEEVAAANPPPPDEPEEPEDDSNTWLYVGIGAGAAVVVAAVVVVVILATGGGTEDPVEGNFNPGVLEW